MSHSGARSGIVPNVFETQSEHAVFIRYSRGLKVLGLQLFLHHLWLFLVQLISTYPDLLGRQAIRICRESGK